MEFKLETFHRNVSKDDLLDDLRRCHALAASQAKGLTYRGYVKHGKYSASTIAERFGTWNAALGAAQIDAGMRRDIPVDDLFDNLRSVWIAKGRQPVFRDMGQAPSRYSASTYAARFGGWRNALMKFLESLTLDRPEPFGRVVSDALAEVAGPKKTQRQPNLRLKFRVMRRDRFMCIKCGRSPSNTPGLILEIDHVMAWSRGGQTREENLQTLCWECNRGKSDTEDR
jgi:hypothetical protein